MAASEEAYGAGHPATFTTQPAPTHRSAELSEIAFDGRPPSFSVPIEPPKRRTPEDDERDT